MTSGLKKVTDDMKTHKNPGNIYNNLEFLKDLLRIFVFYTPMIIALEWNLYLYLALRESGAVPAKAKSGSPKPAKTFGAPVATNKPPKFELEGKKWAVEFHKNNPNLVIENTETNQSVYVYKCEGSTLKIEGKVNNLVLDGCKKTAVVFDDVVSSCEFINCQSVQMQVGYLCL